MILISSQKREQMQMAECILSIIIHVSHSGKIPEVKGKLLCFSLSDVSDSIQQGNGKCFFTTRICYVSKVYTFNSNKEGTSILQKEYSLPK